MCLERAPWLDLRWGGSRKWLEVLLSGFRVLELSSLGGGSRVCGLVRYP